jgi:hypothetical protein
MLQHDTTRRNTMQHVATSGSVQRRSASIRSAVRQLLTHVGPYMRAEAKQQPSVPLTPRPCRVRTPQAAHAAPAASAPAPCTADEPSPGADVGGASPVPVQMSQGRAQSRRRCGRGEPSHGADVGGASPVPAQMWPGCVAAARCRDERSSAQLVGQALQATGGVAAGTTAKEGKAS